VFSVENSVVKTLDQFQLKLLAMKLQLPNLPLNHVKRSELHKKVDADTSQVYLLSAAAGYGKTLFLAELMYAKKHALESVAWLTLDAKENDPKRFLTYLSAAFYGVSHTHFEACLRHLTNDEPLDDVFNQIMNRLETFKGPLHIAFDDVQHIKDEQVLNWIERLLVYCPSHIRLYIASRDNLPFRQSKWVNQGKLLPINEHHLRFSEQELEQWFEQRSFTYLDRQAREEFAQLSLGWPAGLNMLKTLYDEYEMFDMTQPNSVMQDYFHEHWRAAVSKEQYQLCCNIALLEQVCPNYLVAVYGDEGIYDELPILLNGHKLVLPLEPYYSWVELHPMLQHYLRWQGLESIQAVYGLACDWLHANNYQVAAVEMALKAQDKLKAAQLLQQTAETILEDQDIAQLLQWRQQIPDDVIIASPRLVIIFSWALALALQLDDSERLMAQMAQIDVPVDKSAYDEISGQLFAIRAYIARCKGNIDNAEALCQQALEKLPKRNFVARAVTYFNLANVSMTKNDIDAARQHNRLSFETARAAGSIHLEMLAIHEHARLEQVKGLLNLAIKRVDEGLHLSHRLENRSMAPAYGRLLIYKGYLYLLQNKTTEAKTHILEGLSVSKACRDSYVIMAYILLSQLYRQGGDIERAFDFLSDAEAQMQRWNVPSFIYMPWVSTVRSNLLVDQGKVEVALANIKSLYQQAEHAPYSLSPEHFPALKSLLDIFYVRARSINGQHKEALKLLDQVLEQGNVNQNGFALLFVYLMRALLRFQLGREEDALHDFRTAIKLAENDDCIMPFIEYSSGMGQLYEQLPINIKQKPFVQAILQNIELSEDASPNKEFARMRLVISAREMSVLKLIAEGLSNQEIAEKLFISLHTVKTHARRINSKLAVKSRTQAILKAKELGIL